MNKTIKFLMLSDILILTSFGLIEPILAIFFKENLIGGTILMAGLASTIFILTKSFIQLPFSKFIDSHNHKTKLKWLIIGSILLSTVPFIYIFATHIRTIFIAQTIYGIGSGLAFPAWLGLWSTHLDKKKESYEWSLYSTLTGIGTALTAIIGATIAQYLGFTFTFIIVGTISIIGCLILIYLNKKIK
jgi:DHA1 family quinolone resistance protein-like MFS transporter